MKILNFGSCNLDHVYSVDHIVNTGETEAAEKLNLFAGGKGLNQSIAAARAGAEVYHAGCVGADGGMLLDVMTESGVDISNVRTVEEKTGHAIIQVTREGANSIVLYSGANNSLTEEFIDGVLDRFSEGDIILLQNETNLVDYVVERAYLRGMQVVLNPSPFNEKLSLVDFSKLSYIIMNEVEAREISGSSDIEVSLAYMKNKYPSLKVILTLGVSGCIYSTATERFFHPAYSVTAVDTTAAGDTFAGYFAATVAGGGSCREAVRLATAASAIAVSRPGAAPSIPEREEVLSILPSLRPAANPGDGDKIREKIESYVDESLRDARLDALAEILGYSSVYTSEVVKRVMGKSFSKLLQDKRCTLAAKMLAETDMTVERIIYTLGYENESFFRKIFKEKYGTTPFEYRKNIKKR